MSAEAWIHRWETFWFQEVPPEIYAGLRIVFGLLGAISILGLTPLSMFWSIDGLAPVPGSGLGLRAALSSAGLGGVAGAVCFGALVTSFVAMTIGWHSRLAVFACLFGSVLQTRWNGLPLSAAHQVLISVLFCLLWADTGAAWSVDRRRLTTPPETRAAHAVAIWPLRLLQFQVAIVYLSSGLWKLLAPEWRDGVAVHYAASHSVFHRFPLPLPSQPGWFIATLTWTTLFWELAFAFMVLHRRTRWLALALGVLLHTGMWIFLELGPFSWLMMASYLAFVDPQAFARAVARHRGAAVERIGLAKRAT